MNIKKKYIYIISQACKKTLRLFTNNHLFIDFIYRSTCTQNPEVTA